MSALEPPDVLIVGAGPAGLTLSLLLTDLGVRVLCVERRHEVSNAASRSRRPCPSGRDLAGLRRRGADAGPTTVDRATGWSNGPTWSRPVRHTVLTGGPELTEVSPCEGIAISQDLFESVLRERLQEVAPGALRTGIEVQSATGADDGVRTTLLDRHHR